MFCSLLQSLNDLFLALETDTPNIELPRIATFMQQVGQCVRSEVANSYVSFSRLSNSRLCRPDETLLMSPKFHYGLPLMLNENHSTQVLRYQPFVQQQTTRKLSRTRYLLICLSVYPLYPSAANN